MRSAIHIIFAIMSFASLSLASPIPQQNGALSERATPDLAVEIPDPVVTIDGNGGAVTRVA